MYLNEKNTERYKICLFLYTQKYMKAFHTIN